MSGPGTPAERYRAVAEAIAWMADVPKGHSFALDPEQGPPSISFLRLLEGIGAPPPKIFPNGGEQIVFKWKGAADLFATVEDDGVSFGSGPHGVPMTWETVAMDDHAGIIGRILEAVGRVADDAADGAGDHGTEKDAR